MYTYDQGQKVPPGTLPKVGEVWIHDSWPYNRGFEILRVNQLGVDGSNSVKINTFAEGLKFVSRGLWYDGHIQNGRTRIVKWVEIPCPGCEDLYPVSDDYLCSNCRANA
jgi:hypothetical protein